MSKMKPVVTPGEDPLAAVAREAREETGLTALPKLVVNYDDHIDLLESSLATRA
jgi:8-oxo-dGTP pyrophosphatase MutT (NUDIX family)